MCKWNLLILFPKYFQFTIQIVFYQCDRSLIHLLAITVDQFDSVVIIRIMACRNHDPAIKFIRSCHISNRWCCCNMKQVSICSRCNKSTYQCIFEHVAGTSRILSNYNTCRCIITILTFYFSIVPSEKSSDLVRMICC